MQEMFTNIAHRYDLMNQIMTARQDIRWRREVIRRASLPPDGVMLDLGTGTGDLARETLQQYPRAQVVAADFTVEMMRVGQERSQNGADTSNAVGWTASDAQILPFPNQTFDACVSGFLLRNVSNLDQCLREQYRVLKPGGRIISLDTTPPPPTPLAPLLRFHLHTIIPTIGGILTGRKEAYTYLPDSTERFLEPERLASRLLFTGFKEVGFRRTMFGTIAIHWARKPIHEA